MRRIDGVPGISQRIVWAYRGFTITQRTRSYDVRNKTNRGYDWTISGPDMPDRFTHTRKNARVVVDAIINTELS